MPTDHFFYREEGILKRVALDELVYMEVSDNYVRFHAFDRSYLVRATLESVIEQLTGHPFVQVHRSFAVAVKHIDMIKPESIIMGPFPDIELPLSKKYVDGLMEWVRVLG